jgi:hypothetical protein
MAVLLHLKREDVPQALGTFYKALKPKGKIFIGLKQGEGTEYVKDKLSTEKRLFTYFSEDEFKGLLKECRFKILKTYVVSDDAGREYTTWLRFIAEKI